MNPSHNRHRLAAVAAAALAATSLLAACGGRSSTGTNSQPTSSLQASGAGASQAPATGQVLPVTANPITSTATADGLQIKSVIVENNVDPSTGKDTSDHLEIALANTGSAELRSVEVYYTFDDPKTGASESYYLKLPDTFTVPAGSTRIAHFDDSGIPDHFPVNKFSLYHTDTNPLTVTVTVSATGVKVQTATVNKDAGGAETAD